MQDEMKPNEKGSPCLLSLQFYGDGDIKVTTAMPLKELVKCLQTITLEMLYKDLKQPKQNDSPIVKPEMFLARRNEHH